jgi:hypothetical protein
MEWRAGAWRGRRAEAAERWIDGMVADQCDSVRQSGGGSTARRRTSVRRVARVAAMRPAGACCVRCGLDCACATAECLCLSWVISPLLGFTVWAEGQREDHYSLVL